MSSSLKIFFQRNKKFIAIVIALWVIGFCAVGIVALFRKEKDTGHIPQYGEGYIPPISDYKKSLIMSEPDLQTPPLKVSDRDRELIMNNVDTHSQALPQISDSEKIRIQKGQ